MTAPVYADIVSGSMTGITYVKIQRGRVWRNPAVRMVQGAGDSAVIYKSGRAPAFLAAEGVYNPSSNTYPDPTSASATCSLFADIQHARVTKGTPLRNTSGATLTDMATAWWSRGAGRDRYQVAIGGNLRNPEYPLEAGTTTISSILIPLSSTDSVQASAGVVSEIAYMADFMDDPPYDISATIDLSGTVTLNGSTNPFTATSFSGVFIVDNRTGTGGGVSKWSGTVKPRSMSAIMDYQEALPATIQFHGVFHDTITISNTL